MKPSTLNPKPQTGRISPLDLIVQQVIIIISVASLLKRLAEVENPKLSIMAGCEKSSNGTNVVAVRRRVDAGDRHGDQTVKDIGQIRIEIPLRIYVTPTVHRHYCLQPHLLRV